jgi:glycosyltransferase involved in cell wall biosynthesis
VDSVIDGVTGILVDVGDAGALGKALELVLEDEGLAAALGTAGRARVQREFQQERIWDAIVQEYLQELRYKGLPVPNPAVRKMVTTAVTTDPMASR